MCDEFQSSAVISFIPDLLMDVDKVAHASRPEMLERLEKFNSKVFDSFILEFDEMSHDISAMNIQHSEFCEKLRRQIEEIKQEIPKKRTEQEILKKQIAVTSNILEEDNSSLPDDDDLSDLMGKLYILKEEIEFQKKRLQSEIYQHKRGILLYKRYLQCNVIYEPKDKQVIFTLNCSANNVSDAREYVRFTAKENGASFQYIDMSPKLRNEKSLVEKFNETQNIQAFILSFWKAVKSMKQEKMLKEQNK